MITDEQIATFERAGVVTIDTPLTREQLEAASQLMDELLPLHFSICTTSTVMM